MPLGNQSIAQPEPLRQKGFTMIAVIAAMFLLALASQKVMQVVSQQAQREREAQLLQIGAAITQAIGAYYESSPGSIKRWPVALHELTDDSRFVGIRRYLRQIYDDPITRSNQWGLVRTSEGGIMGVYSQSDASPIRTGPVQENGLNLPAASRYTDWQFVYQPVAFKPAP
jgi:type II secretory pathway pseudopilin PulG